MNSLPPRTISRLLIVGLLVFGWAAGLRADPDSTPPPRPSHDELATIASSLKWQTGTITLKDGLAKLNLSDDFRFLDSADAGKVLHDIWGNPSVPDVLGMIFPAKVSPLDHGGWGMIIEYEEGGYIKDDDATKIDYAALLQQMQKQVSDENPEREKQGYPPVTLVGWATPPRYDAQTHKLYWAKDVKFGDGSSDTLNYNIRVLGRRGVLLLNAVAPMREFSEVDGEMPKVLAMVDFQPGNTYADFDPKVDKIATYGLATLIAGGALGVAAKVGMFKFLLPALLALKKFAILAVVAIGAFFKKISGRFSGKGTKSPGAPPAQLPPQQRP